MEITVRRSGGKLQVASPFTPDLSPLAKNISGRWNSDERVWEYPEVAESEVRALYIAVYGQWDEQVERVNLVCYCKSGSNSQDRKPLVLGSLLIASARGRDSGARVADGVVVQQGGFTSGGSMKNWNTSCQPETTFKLLDISVRKAYEIMAYPEWCDKVWIDGGVSLEALRGERETLVKRIEEIDAIIEREEGNA